MTVTLELVTRSVDGIPAIRDVSLKPEEGALRVLFSPTPSGDTSSNGAGVCLSLQQRNQDATL